jgi:hypothetical protein
MLARVGERAAEVGGEGSGRALAVAKLVEEGEALGVSERSTDVCRGAESLDVDGCKAGGRVHAVDHIP